MIAFEEINFKNPGVLIADLPDEVWEPLTKSLDMQIANKDKLWRLKEISHPKSAGIKEAMNVSLPDEFLKFGENFVYDYFKYFKLKTPTAVSLANVWLNLQKKYEFRPIHRHHTFNKHVSFVLWYKIPFLIEDEDSYSNHYKAEIYRNGRFEFMVDSYSGDKIFHRIPADKTYEGKMILFPNGMYHTVYPFYTSDEYRISLAGNFEIQHDLEVQEHGYD